MTTFHVYGRCTRSNASFVHSVRAFHPSEARAILSVREPDFEVIAINR